MARRMAMLEDVPRPTSKRTKPQLALRKLRRSAVTKLRHFLVLVLQQDLREARRGETVGYTPFLFTEAKTSPTKTAVTQLIARCDVALRSTV